MFKPIDNNMSHTLHVRAQGLRDNKSIHQTQVADLIDTIAALQEDKRLLREALIALRNRDEGSLVLSRKALEATK